MAKNTPAGVPLTEQMLEHKINRNSYVSQLQNHVEDLEKILERSDQGTQPSVPGMVTGSESAVRAPRYVGDESGNKCVVPLISRLLHPLIRSADSCDISWWLWIRPASMIAIRYRMRALESSRPKLVSLTYLRTSGLPPKRATCCAPLSTKDPAREVNIV